MNKRPYIVLIISVLALVSCEQRTNNDARALYEQGKMLRAEDEHVQAMQCFLQAAHSRTNDQELLGRVWSNMANMCRQANEHQTAYRVYAISANHFFASGDSLTFAYALNNMAWEQAVMAHKDSALALVDSAISVYPQPPLTDKIRETQAAACLFLQQYDSVLFYTAPPANDYLLMLRAQAYSWLLQNDSATYYARILLPRTTNVFFLDDIYYILTHNDRSTDISALRALSSERADIQRAIGVRHGQLMQAVQLLEQDLEKEPGPWLIIAAALIILIATYMGTRYLLARKKRKDILLRQLQLLSESENLRQELEWDDFASFCRKVDYLLMGLAARLAARELKEQDIRIAVLALIGMSHKEIADLLNCSPKSIGKQKDLTARKIGVSGGSLQSKVLNIAIA
ncbi:MAG: hypothetical protein IJP76_02065 [Paludibacteraceae bacterium]|nr:hypothetical protein [Paludibacteraceae bacterium]